MQYYKDYCMSNDKLFYISNSYMLHCSINGWGVMMEKKDVLDYRNLAKTTTRNQFLFITYINKIKKGKPSEKDLPFWKKQYHKYFRPLIFTLS